MNCPKCNSDHIVKSGIRRGKLALVCKTCSYQFVQGALAAGRPSSDSPPCPHCQGEARKLGMDRKGRQRYQCKTCRRISTNETEKNTMQ